MPRFFVRSFNSATPALCGENARHAVKSLRMRPGEQVTVCDEEGMDHLCTIEKILPNGEVALCEHTRRANESEPSVQVTLYQGIPKGDKMDFIIQKAVELGVNCVVPVLMERCVSRPDAKALCKKEERWQKIAEEAAKQSGRGKIPQIGKAVTLKEAAQKVRGEALVLFCYEGGGEPLKTISYEGIKNISVFIGPEGGFADGEATSLREAGAKTVTLGPRILRTETAPLLLLSVVMYQTGNI